MSYFNDYLILKWNNEDCIHIFSEGDYDLDDEDIEEGFVDYIYETIDNIENKTIDEDGGQWLLEELYSEMFKNEEDLVKYVVEEVYHSNLEDVIVLSKEDYKQFMGFDYSDRSKVAMEQYENRCLLNQHKDMDQSLDYQSIEDELWNGLYDSICKFYKSLGYDAEAEENQCLFDPVTKASEIRDFVINAFEHETNIQLVSEETETQEEQEV